MTTLKAFVSSTFTDLKAHRARAIKLLRGGGLHVDPMEDWSAARDEPKSFCLERMKDCALCILLVAFRKGFVPDGESLSITQMEYQYAVDHGIDVLPFLLDDNETDWPEEFDERETDPEIGRWRVRLRKKHGCGVFHADAASLDIGPAVLRWVQNCQTKPGLVSPFDFASFLKLKREGFVGRDWLFAEIEDWRTQRAEKSLLILGDPGIGKSAIAAELVHRYPQHVLAYHCCRADERTTLEPAKIVRALAAQIATRVKLDEEAISEVNCNSDPINAFTKGFLASLRQLPTPPDGVRYLLFDALDEALTRKEAGLNLVEMLAYRLNELPSWLRIVATARREDNVLDKLHGLQALQLNAQDQRNKDDVRLYVKAHVEGAELQTMLVEKSEGNFLYARQALEGIRGEADPLAALRSLPRGLHGIYSVFFERRFSDEARYKRARRVLQVMVAAREPLSESELAAVTGLDEETVLPGVLRQLTQFLVRRQTERGEVVALYHKSLSDWLTGKPLRSSHLYASPKKGHERLADWCVKEYQRGPRRMGGYALRHLPAHLIETQRWDELARVLTDLFYLESKAKAGFVFELATDFSAAGKSLPREHEWHRRLGLLEEALGLDLPFLKRHPTVLFQTLWNRCWWYDCPQAAAHYLEEPDKGTPPWQASGPKLSELLEQWLQLKSKASPGFCWVRMLRPPQPHLGTALRKILVGHERPVVSIAVSPGGKALASGSVDGTVRLWDVGTGVELRLLKGHTNYVHSVTFNADGKVLASGSADKTVRLWDVETGVELRCLVDHTERVWSVSFSADGKILASGSGDKTVRLWDVETGGELRRLVNHTHVVTSVSFSADGKILASGSGDKTVRLWDVETGGELCCLVGHTESVWSVSFSADGKILAAGSGDKTVRLWDVETGVELRRLEVHGGVESVSFSEDGKVLATGAGDNTVRLWDVEAGVELRRLEGHTHKVTRVSFSKDGKVLASGSVDTTVRLWNVETGRELRSLKGDIGYGGRVSFSKDGKILASGSWDKTVRLWDVESGAELRCLQGHKNSVTSVTFSEDGKILASGSWDETVRLWDVESGAELRCLQGHRFWVESVTFSEDGKILASGSDDKTVRLWDVESGLELRCLQGHTNSVLSVSFREDAKVLASGSSDRTVRLWNVETGRELRSLEGHTGGVKSVSFSKDGKVLASGSGDKTVRLWDVESGRCLEVIEGNADPFAFSRADDFRWFAVLGPLETVILNSNTRQPVAWLPLSCYDVSSYPSARIWAGLSSGYACLFALEGGEASSASKPTMEK